MDPNQKNAMEKHESELYERLQDSVGVFLTHLVSQKVITSADQEIINAESTSNAKLVILVRLIRSKDNGWKTTISFLRTNNYASLANKLIKSARKHGSISSENSDNQDLKLRLANHYRSEYSSVPTIFGM